MSDDEIPWTPDGPGAFEKITAQLSRRTTPSRDTEIERIAAVLRGRHFDALGDFSISGWADSLYEAGLRVTVVDGVREADAGSQSAPSTDPRSQPASEPSLDVERLGFRDLLTIGKALIEHYPPDTIVCSHSVKADIGAQTAAAIADLIDSCEAVLSQPADNEAAE